MHYKSIFNALIMLFNAPHDALYDLIIYVMHYNTWALIFTPWENMCIQNMTNNQFQMVFKCYNAFDVLLLKSVMH